jgi:predicted amidohydrolase YtcJ
MRLAVLHASRTGLTFVHDAGLGPDDVADLRALLAAGALPVRVWGMWDATPDTDDPRAYDEALRAGPQPFDPTRHLAMACVKLMADGALGSRGAALLEPYADAPGERGLPQYTFEAFTARALPLHEKGFQLATHAIGDAANRMVLDAYALLLRQVPRPDARHRIEHAQVLAAADIPRFAALGVLPSMQPTHCTSDMPWAADRLGPERVRGAYAWRSLRATGVVIAGGSDAPVEAIAPLPGVYAAVTRQHPGGQPPGGYWPEECLTRSEALRAFTIWAAQAAFAETWTGTLEPGKRADLVVLDRDVVRCPPEEILATRVLRTIVDGRDALDASGASDAARAGAVRIPTH